MPIVTLKDIHISFGSQVIFDRLDLKIYPAQKVGLIGHNGCGKTTLLKMILGILPPDVGQIQQRKGLRIGYLPQEPVFSAVKKPFSKNCTIAHRKYSTCKKGCTTRPRL